MNRFGYQRAGSLGEALDLLGSSPDARILAGGTNLIDLMKYNVEAPGLLIDINRVAGLDGVSAGPDGSLRIGALVSNAALARDPVVERDFPLLSSAILAGATPQLRNAATTGGNLNQRTRCYYFYEPTTPCNKRQPGSGCPAIHGVNRMHAILGGNERCIATHPSDMCVALAALDAVVHLASARGERMVAFADYHRLPGEEPERDNVLEPGEIVTAVELPAAARAFSGHHSYLKLRDRLSYAFALVSVAAALEFDGAVVTQARIALGGVAHKPWRRREAEEALVGRPTGPAAYAEAADILLEGAVGQSHNAFKVELARRAIGRALAQAAAGTPQSQTHKRIA